MSHYSFNLKQSYCCNQSFRNNSFGAALTNCKHLIPLKISLVLFLHTPAKSQDNKCREHRKFATLTLLTLFFSLVISPVGKLSISHEASYSSLATEYSSVSFCPSFAMLGAKPDHREPLLDSSWDFDRLLSSMGGWRKPPWDIPWVGQEEGKQSQRESNTKQSSHVYIKSKKHTNNTQDTISTV